MIEATKTAFDNRMTGTTTAYVKNRRYDNRQQQPTTDKRQKQTKAATMTDRQEPMNSNRQETKAGTQRQMTTAPTIGRTATTSNNNIKNKNSM